MKQHEERTRNSKKERQETRWKTGTMTRKTVFGMQNKAAITSQSLHCFPEKKADYEESDKKDRLVNRELQRYMMDNKDIVKYFYEVIVSENLLDELSKYISEDCVQRAGEKEIFIGIDGMKQHLFALKQTYPDYTMKIIRQYAADDYVISEFIMRGTHKGDFIGITPTNKVLEITGVDIDKVINGKIVEHGGAANTFETFFEHHLIRPV